MPGSVRSSRANSAAGIRSNSTASIARTVAEWGRPSRALSSPRTSPATRMASRGLATASAGADHLGRAHEDNEDGVGRLSFPEQYRFERVRMPGAHRGHSRLLRRLQQIPEHRRTRLTVHVDTVPVADLLVI